MTIFKSIYLCRLLKAPRLVPYCHGQQRNITIRINDRLNNYASEAATDKLAFLKNYPRIVEAAAFNIPISETAIFEDFSDHYKTVLDYSVPHGNLIHGLTLVKAFKDLKRPLPLTDDEIFHAHILAWSVEMIRASFNMVDDIVDGSTTRYLKPSWHKREGLGFQALNDSFLIQLGAYNLLKKYFTNTPYYARVTEMFTKCLWDTYVGQSLDTQFAANYQKTRSLKPFNWENAFTMGRLKALPMVYTPIEIAMTMNGIVDPVAYSQAIHVCEKISECYIVQNDVLDMFGDIDETGKIGTDTQEGKCSWLITTAIQLANKEQLKIIEENNGRKDPECLQKMRNVFLELNLIQLYEEYGQNAYEQIVEFVSKPTFKLPADMFLYCFHFIYRAKWQ